MRRSMSIEDMKASTCSDRLPYQVNVDIAKHQGCTSFKARYLNRLFNHVPSRNSYLPGSQKWHYVLEGSYIHQFSSHFHVMDRGRDLYKSVGSEEVQTLNSLLNIRKNVQIKNKIKIIK